MDRSEGLLWLDRAELEHSLAGRVISGMQGCGESGKSSGTTSSKSSTPSRLRPNTTSQYLQRIVEYVRCRLAQAGDSTADGKH